MSVINLNFKRTKEAVDKIDNLANSVDKIQSTIVEKHDTVNKLHDRINSLDNEFKNITLEFQNIVKKDDLQNVLNEIIDNLQDILLNQTPRQINEDLKNKYEILDKNVSELNETVKTVVTKLLDIEDNLNSVKNVPNSDIATRDIVPKLIINNKSLKIPKFK